jgi:uncharacterized protein YeaO (DUF488 family)
MRQRVLNDEVTNVGIRLVDEAHTAWFVAQIECADALCAWFQATARRRADANLTYRAALDREEAAARDLERLTTLAVKAA